MKFIRWFNTVRMSDVGLVGGKNASLGEMISQLASQGIRVPQGFAVTADAYWHYLDSNNLRDAILERVACITREDDMDTIERVGKEIRALIIAAHVPDDLAKELTDSYRVLSEQYKQRKCDVAVRSSATAEDLPTASFAGQQETYLNVRGDKNLLDSYKKSLSSLFTDRAMSYRFTNKFDTAKVGLSVGVQKMIRSDKASAGVAFSLDTETGFANVIMIDAAYGLGEGIVKGWVNPDEFVVFKPTMDKGVNAIIQKKCGDKKTKIVYAKTGFDHVKRVAVPKKARNAFSINNEQIVELARMVQTIENHYSALHTTWTPMDVEWACDGIDGQLYIVQARPETVHTQQSASSVTMYRLNEQPSSEQILVTGQSIGQKIAAGMARVITSIDDAQRVKQGDIIVTSMTDPDWGPILQRAGGIITDLGGRTCHAAIVSREMGTPAIVGTGVGTKKISDGQIITLDASRGTTGFVYDGAVPFNSEIIQYADTGKSPVPLMVNIADPDRAFYVNQLPVAGVGLARIEFIITNYVQVHPMALLYREQIVDKKTTRMINCILDGYRNGAEYFVDTLSQGIARIAAAFYPRPVIVRLSDFKTNEYRNLLGGVQFEPIEENPMIGFRGAARYINPEYRAAFDLECQALKRVRDDMGLHNVRIMVPFVRTVGQARDVVSILAHNGLERGKNGLELVMMCEVPSNVLLCDEFSHYFDGFSIGSNDLTQLVLGTDRDSALLANIFDERDPAVKKMICAAIEGAHRNKRPIGICGQAPSDYPEFAQFIIEQGIDSISLNPDSVLPFLLHYRK